MIEFNEGRFWEAHERWERGWKALPAFHRRQIQIAIQVAGVLHLLKLGRRGGALSLARSALSKMEAQEKATQDTQVKIQVFIEGARDWLSDFMERGEGSEESFILSARTKLVARLISEGEPGRAL